MKKTKLLKLLSAYSLTLLFVLNFYFMATANWTRIPNISIFAAALDTGASTCGLMLAYAITKESYSYYKGSNLLPGIVFLNTIVLLLDNLGISLSGNPHNQSIVFWGSYLYLVAVYILSALFLQYYMELSDMHRKWRKPAAFFSSSIFLLLLAILLLNYRSHFLFFVTEDATLQHGPYAPYLALFPALVLFSSPVLLLPSKSLPKLQKNAISLSSVIIMISIPVLMLMDKITILYSFSMLTIIIFFYSIYLKRGVDLSNNRKLLLEKQMEIAREQQKIMLSQIQPHFIFNTLGAIAHLCKKNPEKAYATTNDFAEYMRHNLESLTGSPLVSFEKELDHVKKYLSIEQTRFGSALSIIYDIGPRDFQVPVLSIQPLVENAVKHGLLKKKGGGTLILRTEDAEKNYLITIKDDGVGFNPNQINDDGKNHVGIANVRMRLEGLCSAIMGIISVPGKGTTVHVFIPKH